jgi:hypothetical protein
MFPSTWSSTGTTYHKTLREMLIARVRPIMERDLILYMKVGL